MNLSRAERIELAALAGINEQYLYQCLTGRGAMKPEEAVRVETATGRRLCRWHLRPNDWDRIWPELKDHGDAPKRDPQAAA